jgi:signal transduction histidine kinase
VITPLRVLIVEDNPDDATLILLELRRGGYDVFHQRVETDGAMAAALARARWDIILSDFAMPRFGAPAALALLRQKGLDIPFIIVSGTVGDELAVKAMRAGANDYLFKGNLSRLCPAIDRELREAKSRAERRRMQEQLLIADRMASIGTIAAGVAHEINNPLAAVVVNLDLLAKDLARLGDDNGIAEQMDAIFDELRDAREAADRLRHIARDLKVFSRFTDEERKGPVDVRRVIESSLRMAWPEIRHRARLVKEYGDVPPVEANEQRLGQVVLNLVVNAAQAIKEGNAEANVIRISTEVDPLSGRVVVQVRDTGAGIPPETLPRIFDAFFTTKPVGVGTGLGLSICHKIITGLGGDIDVDSEVGKGTTFRVSLPALLDERAGAPLAVPASSSTRRGRVLIIDDELVLARALGRAIEREHDVAIESSGETALRQIVAGSRFDLILCDLMMPQMTGMELYDHLVREVPEQAARMVFLTGGAFTPSARKFLDDVSNQRIEKPFDSQQVLAIVNERVR